MDMDEFNFLKKDFSLDVLSRLRIEDVLQMKCVSREWNNLLSTRAFTKVLSRKKEPMSGFLVQQKYRWSYDDIKTISYVSAQSDRPALQQTFFSFLPEDVVMLASCNGLVCCRSCYPFENPSIYVCNPVNREWIRTNFTKPVKESSIALVFDPLQDIGDTSTDFKLVRVEQIETESSELYFSFDIFSSDTRAWKTSKELCQFNNEILVLYKNKGVLIGGILHWLTNGEKILTFHVENELSLLIPVPISSSHFRCYPEGCIGESNGQLHYVMVSEQGIHVWLLEDYFEFKWTLKHAETLETLEEEHPSFFYNLRERVSHRKTIDSTPWVDPWAFRDGYLLMRVCAKIYLYNVETKRVKRVCELSHFGSKSVHEPMVLPCSLSLVPLL